MVEIFSWLKFFSPFPNPLIDSERHPTKDNQEWRGAVRGPLTIKDIENTIHGLDYVLLVLQFLEYWNTEECEMFIWLRQSDILNRLWQTRQRMACILQYNILHTRTHFPSIFAISWYPGQAIWCYSGRQVPGSSQPMQNDDIIFPLSHWGSGFQVNVLSVRAEIQDPVFSV